MIPGHIWTKADFQFQPGKIPVTKTKRLLFILLSSLLAVVILAAGLDDLTLLGTQWFDLGPYTWQVMTDEVMFRAIFTALAFIVIAVLMAMTDREFWRNLLPALGIIGLIILALLAVMPLAAINQEITPPASAVELPTDEEVPEEERSMFDQQLEVAPPASEPGWLNWVVTLLLASATAVGVALIGRTIWLTIRPTRRPLADLAAEAQAALDSLQAGDSFPNAIIRCYVEMGRILDELRQIKRPQAMTPREFADQLVQLGLPRQAITSLTRLFEAVRYGMVEVTPADQAEAIGSLEAIIAACQPAEGETGRD
jgi:hypothetical protein